MSHDHVRIAVHGAQTPGVEYVPARKLDGGGWELLRSPLYAMQVAAGDVIRVVDQDAGAFEILHRGGNVCVQFYLPPSQADDTEATEQIANEIEAGLPSLGGRTDSKTAGLISFSVPVKAGFSAIERVFEGAARRHAGAQWQYGNIYDQLTDEPIGWWKA